MGFSERNIQVSKICFFICSNIVKEKYKIVEKKINLNEAIDYYLDNLEVSPDDSDNEDNINFQLAKIFIQPPVNIDNVEFS